MKIFKKIPTIITILFLVDILFGLVYLLLYKYGDPTPTKMLIHTFDLDAECNLPTWFSSIQLFCVSILLGIFAYYNFNKSKPRSWFLILLPVLFLICSADEVAQFHEHIGKIIDIIFPNYSRNQHFFKNTGIWMFVIGIPFIIILIILLKTVWSYFKDYKRDLIKLILGISIWLFGALVLESFSNLLVLHSKYYVIEVFFEEVFEMIGITFVIWASLNLILKNNNMIYKKWVDSNKKI